MSAIPKKQPIVFGKYLLLDRINIGGMAEVWRGKTFGTGGFERLVAIKRILPNIAEDDEFKTMFIDEAKISVQLTHSNIAQVHDLGQIGNSLFIAMEYIPGKDLRAIFDRSRKKGEPAPIPLTCYVISKLCDALDYAHRKKDSAGRDMNIVHRDVSPQNVLISFDGDVKVIDFGIAKAAGKATKTQAGILKGKFGYMSPEQIRGLPLDRRSDIFAIGVCLYELLTGERLFVGDSDFSVLEKVRRAEVLAPSTYNRRVGEALERVVLRALAKDVEVRYQYASELFKDLQPFIMQPDVFTQRDLAQYMKSTFVEDVEREKQRLQEYSEIKAVPVAPAPPPQPADSPTNPQVLVAAAPATLPPDAPQNGLAPLANAIPLASQSRAPTLVGVGLAKANAPARAVSSNGLPKLTPATGSSQERDAATQLVAAPARTDTDPKWDEPIGIDTEPPSTLDPEPQTRSDRPMPAPVSRPHGTSPTLASTSVAPPVAITPTVPATPSAMPSSQNGRSHTELPARNPSPAGATAGTVNGSASSTAMPAQAAASASVAAAASASVAGSTGPHPALLVRPIVEISKGATHAQVSAAVAPAPAPAKGGKLRLVGAAFIGLLLVLCGAVAGYFLHAGASGFVSIDVPASARSKARVSINGKDIGAPESWPLIQRVPAGTALIKVSVEGYAPFVQTVDVPEGKTTVPVKADLAASNDMGSMVVVTEPDSAGVKAGGKVVKKEGTFGFHSFPVPMGEVKIEVSKRGYRTVMQSYTVSRNDEPLVQLVKLQPSEYQAVVESEPSGATVFAGAQELGVTPFKAHLKPEIAALTFRKKCFQSVDLTLKPPTDPTEDVKLSAELPHQSNCR